MKRAASVVAAALLALAVSQVPVRAEGPRDGEAVLSGPPTEPPPKAVGLAYYEELAKKHPDDPSAHQLVAAGYAREGRLDDARRAAKRAIELAPDLAEAHQALGLVDEGAGELRAAEESFRRAVALDGNVELRLDLARVVFLQSRLDEARAMWSKIAADFATDVEVQFALADAFRALGRTDDALVAYERALVLATGERRIDILVEEARMLADRGDTARAHDILAAARKEAPKQAEVPYNLGVLFVRMGDTERAIAAFKDALALDPKLARAQNNLGVALDKAGRHEDARAAFQDAVRIDPGLVDALYNLGLVSFKLGKLQDARAAFEKALARAPDMADAKLYLGEVYYQLGDAQKALRIYKEGLRSNPDDGAAHRRIGDIYLQQGDVGLAVGEYWAAVDADEHDGRNRAQLMRVLLVRGDEGDVRRAVKLGSRGLELDATDVEVRAVLADAEAQQGRSPRARQILEEGIRVAPQDARAHLALGQFVLKLGDLDTAKARFEEVLTLDKNNAPALAALGTVAHANGDRPLAIKHMRAALGLDPTLAAARADLGRLLYDEGKNDEALRELERATKDEPRLGKAWFYLAFAQNKAGRGIPAVEKSLEMAVATEPDLAEAHVQLGRIRAAADKKDEACKSFKKALDARPSYEEALIEVERLSCR